MGTGEGKNTPWLAAERRQSVAPGASPGFSFEGDLSPGGAKESFGIFRPSGAEFQNDIYPGLTPGATLYRRSAAEYRRLRIFASCVSPLSSPV